MKLSILALSLILSTNAFAHGSSHPDEQTANQFAARPPCFIMFTSVTYINAYTVSSIEKWGAGRVIVYHGKNYSVLDVGKGNEVAYIQKAVQVIQQNCK